MKILRRGKIGGRTTKIKNIYNTGENIYLSSFLQISHVLEHIEIYKSFDSFPKTFF
jgi:hypothetical protein